MKRTLTAILLVSLFSITQVYAQTCQTTNIAAGKTVTTSYQLNYAPASNVVDGSLSTQWLVDVSGDQWIYIDLGQSYTVCKVLLKWDTWHPHNDFKIQSSANASTWTDLATVNTAALYEGSYAYSYHLVDLSSNTTAGRYIRLYFNGMTPFDAKLEEVEINNKTSSGTPTVSISNPANNAVLAEDSTIHINASASDSGGTITKVEFYRDTVKLGTDSTSPYSYALTHPDAGTYTISAKATDNDGNSNTATIHFIVEANSAAWSTTGNIGNTDTNFIGTVDKRSLIFRTNNIERGRFDSTSGILFIGTAHLPTSADSTTKLAVKGAIHAQKVKVTLTDWPDYVFNPQYKMLTLPEINAYIQQHKHLPGIPSDKTMIKEGLDVGSGQALLLQKIEELTLYMIEQDKRLKKQQQEINKLKKQLKK